MINIQQRFLLDLDTIIDTRLGTIKKNWPENINAANLEEYHGRDHIRIWDIFGIGKEEYIKAYAERDVITISNSFGTQLAEVLRSILSTSILKAEANQHIDQIKVVINVYPYKLNDNELQVMTGVLKDILMVNVIATSKIIGTGTVSIDLCKHSAGELKKQFDCIFIYDLVEWLRKTNKLTAKHPAPTLTVYYAAILTEDSDEDRRKITDGNVNPFKNVRRACAGHFLAEGLDIELFNIIKV